MAKQKKTKSPALTPAQIQLRDEVRGLLKERYGMYYIMKFIQDVAAKADTEPFLNAHGRLYSPYSLRDILQPSRWGKSSPELREYFVKNLKIWLEKTSKNP